MGKGASVTLAANGKKVAEGRVERTIPIQFSLGEGWTSAWKGAKAAR
jgi:arylsulfatase